MDAAVRLAEPTPDEEIALARAEIASGRAVQAVERLKALIARLDLEPMLYYWLSAAHGAAGELEAQRDTLRDAQTYHALQVIRDAGGDLNRFRTDPTYAFQVGQQFYQAKLMGPASVAFAQAALAPGASPQAMLSWGLSLQHQGRIEEAVTAFTAAVQAHPGAKAHEFLLYVLFFAEDGTRRHAEEVRRWAELYAPPPPPTALRFDNPPSTGRKLRIGYVAPGFLGTQVRQFVMPVLEGHDRGQFDIFLYANDAAAEAAIADVTARSIGALSDADAARLIRQDGIDVLIDLWGHTAGGRLGIFAMKPAPVQAAWINYVQSTGLTAMDHVIHADALDVPGTAELFSEEIWRIGPVMAPFRPSSRAKPTPTPALARGHVSFASFNHPSRLNDATVAAWARILNGRPGSRLILKYDYFVDPVLQNATCARFAAHGADPARIDFRGRTSGAEYLSEFGDIDLALDPSPAPGGTTSSEAVANGVPVLTLKGPDFYSRIGVLRLEPLGLHELVAEDWDDYVARALSLTEDVQALQAIRQRVVDNYEGSAIRDEAGFTCRLEDAFRGMFARWEGRAP